MRSKNWTVDISSKEILAVFVLFFFALDIIAVSSPGRAADWNPSTDSQGPVTVPARTTGTPITPLPGGTINIGSGWASTTLPSPSLGGIDPWWGPLGVGPLPPMGPLPPSAPVEKIETTTRTNPDGSTTTTTTNPDDGSMTSTTTYSDGSTSTTTDKTNPDGSTSTTTTRTQKNPDGSWTSTTTFRDGITVTTTVKTNPDGSNTYTATYSDGSSWVERGRDGKIIHDPKVGAGPSTTGAGTAPGTTEKPTQPPGSPKQERPVLDIKLVTLGGLLADPVIHLDPGPATTPEEFVKPQQQITGTPPLIPVEKIETTTRTNPDASKTTTLPDGRIMTTWKNRDGSWGERDRDGKITLHDAPKQVGAVPKQPVEVSVPVDNREQTNVGIPPGQDAKEAAKALGGTILATGPQGAIISTVGDPKTIEKKAQKIGLKTNFVEKNFCTIMTPLTPFRGHDHKAHEHSGRGPHEHDGPDPPLDWGVMPPEIVVRLE